MHTATRGPGRRKHHYANSYATEVRTVCTYRSYQGEVLQVLASDQAPATAVRLKQPAVEDREDRAVTRRDVRLIMPTLLILLFTILVIMTVIPYAFSSVIKQVRMMMSELRIRTTHSSLNVQLHAVQAMEAIKVSGGWRWRMSSFFSKNCPQQEMGLFKGILHPWTRKSHHHNKNI